MKQVFAIPTENGALCTHFGHCEKFAVVDTENGRITAEKMIEPPVHQPGVYPAFLAEMGVNTIIAGGMGQKARDLFAHNRIEVIYGVDADSPSGLVERYFAGSLAPGTNKCDH